MTDVNNQAADSSNAATLTPEPFDLATLTREERQTWRDTGNIPEKKSPSSADSATAKPSSEGKEETSNSQNAAPASEAGKSKESKPHRDTADDRKAALNAEIRDLLKQRDTLKSEVEGKDVKPKTESSTVKPVETSELKEPVEPKEEDFGTYEEFRTAEKKYYRDVAKYEAAVLVRDAEAKRTQQAALEQTRSQLSEAEKKYPDWNDVAKPFIGKIADSKVHPAVTQVLNATKNLTDVMYAIGGSKDADNIAELAQTNPAEAIRQIAVYEYLVSQELKGSDKAVEKKIPEPVTKAPKPVTELSARGAGGEDPATAAVRANDYRAASREWNRQATGGK